MTNQKPARYVAFALGLSAVLVLPACSSSNAGSTRLTLKSHNTDRADLHLSPKSPSIGDEIAADGEFTGPDGAVIGHFELTSFVTREAAGREQRIMIGEYNFGDGGDAIMIMGANDYPSGGGLPDKPLRFAVTGGVGKYAGARGQCKDTLNGSEFTLECDLTGVKA